MEVHTLEIDSSERDYSKYPDPHDYVIDLKNEIYDIQKITLLSARIPNSQTLIHAHNNTFSVNTFQGSASSLTLTGSGITTKQALATAFDTLVSSNDIGVTFNGQGLVLTNESTTLTKYIDFSGTESSKIGIPAQAIELIPNGTYTGQDVIFGSISSLIFDIQYTDIQRSTRLQGGSYTNRNTLAATLSQSLGSDLNVVYDGTQSKLNITNTSTFTYALIIPTNKIGIATTTTIVPGSTYVAGIFTNSIPSISTASISFTGGFYSSGTTLASDLSAALSDLDVTFTSNRLSFTNVSGSNYQLYALGVEFGVPGTRLIQPGDTYTGDVFSLNPVATLDITYTISNATKTVSFPGGFFANGNDLASAFSSSTGIRTLYIDKALRLFNESIFITNFTLTGTASAQIGITAGNISLSPSTYHQGTVDIFGIIPDLPFDIEDILMTDIQLPNRSFANGDDLASNVTDHITNINVTYDSNTNALSWLNNANNDQILKFGDGTNARYASGTDDTLSNLITSHDTTPHQIFGLPPQNITIPASGTYTDGSINLKGPNALLLRLGVGSETFNKDVYVREPFYTGQLLLNGDYVNYTSTDDPVEHTFFSGSHKNLKQLHINFFTMSQGRLIPYDFRNQEHILKFKIECNTGKFKAIAKHTAPEVGVLPPPISIPDFEDPYRWNQQYVLISVILFFGVFILFITRKRT